MERFHLAFFLSQLFAGKTGKIVQAGNANAVPAYRQVRQTKKHYAIKTAAPS